MGCALRNHSGPPRVGDAWNLSTGKFGDGKQFVYKLSRVVRVRTGEKDYNAL